jgi:hypothetical protein
MTIRALYIGGGGGSSHLGLGGIQEEGTWFVLVRFTLFHLLDAKRRGVQNYENVDVQETANWKLQ